MSFMDDAKDQLGNLAEEHPEQVDAAIDKGAEELDQRTGGEHTDQIEGAADKAKEALGVDDQGGGQGGGRGGDQGGNRGQ